MKNKRRNDLLLAGSLLLVALIGFWVFRLTLTDGAYVTVSVDGAETARYPLNEDRDTVIATGEDGINRLVIRDGQATVTEANCPDKICVGHRPISMEGETIVCLPHKVVVAVTGEGE